MQATQAVHPVGLDRDDLDMALDAIRQYAGTHLPDTKLRELDAADEFPEAIVREMCGEGLGVSLLFIDEEFGGMGGGAIDIYRVCEQLAAIDVGIATGVLATFLGSDPILFGGTPEQRKHWMTRIAAEGLLMAYGATEPEAGSDLASMKTTAEPVVEEGQVVGYVLNGNKQWISNGGYADVYTVLARAPGGPTWFVVERDTPGFTHGKPEDKHGIRASNTATLSLQDVQVDVDAVVGGAEGLGLLQAQAVFGYTRLMVAAFGLGAGWAALSRAIEYSTQRVQAGGPLSEKEGYTHKLIVPHAVRLEAARAYIEETAARLDAGEQRLNTEGAIAKYMATEAGNAAAEAAIQAHGGYGYTKEYMVEKFKRDVRITTIYEGPSEIMEMTIARDRWQEHLKTRGRYYHDAAAGLEQLAMAHPDVGADVAALSLHALAEVLEQARLHKLTRHQHVLFRVGELIAYGECAAAFARRAAVAGTSDELSTKIDRRFDAEALACLSRVFARDAAMKIGLDGLRWLIGSAPRGELDPSAVAQAVGIDTIERAQLGLVDDMSGVAHALSAPYRGGPSQSQE
jgi:alkylation response protein AidB-like acyl-CoA dehydrogenase